MSKLYEGDVKQPYFGNLEQYLGSDRWCFSDPTMYSAMRVNFAGQFVLAACSCGSGCHYLFVWDAKTGKVYQDFPFGAINVRQYEDMRGQPVRSLGEQYRVDSKLLILDGCIEGACDCAKRYYVWKGTQFQLLHRIEHALPVGCMR